jgi:hypothetical protein
MDLFPLLFAFFLTSESTPGIFNCVLRVAHRTWLLFDLAARLTPYWRSFRFPGLLLLLTIFPCIFAVPILLVIEKFLSLIFSPQVIECQFAFFSNLSSVGSPKNLLLDELNMLFRIVHNLEKRQLLAPDFWKLIFEAYKRNPCFVSFRDKLNKMIIRADQIGAEFPGYEPIADPDPVPSVATGSDTDFGHLHDSDTD